MNLNKQEHKEFLTTASGQKSFCRLNCVDVGGWYNFEHFGTKTIGFPTTAFQITWQET